MHNLEFLYRTVDTIAVIWRNVTPLYKKFEYISFYIKILITKPVKFAFFEKHKIYFQNYSSFISSIVEIFFNQSYYFNTSTSTPLIIDCGANIGITALYFKKIYPQAKIICLEPIPETYKLLKKNTKHFNDLAIHATGVAYNTKYKYVYVPKNVYADSMNFSSSKNRWPKDTNFKKIKIKTIKLSSLIKSPVDCLILDIEGDEDQILQDLVENKKLKYIKNIFLEFHNYNNQSLSTITNILTKNNFELVIGSGVRPPYTKYKGKFWSLPIYAFNKNL